MYTLARMRNKIAIASALALGMLACGVASATPTAMNFDGIPAADSVDSYYGGGCSTFLHHPDACNGPNLGVAWNGATVDGSAANPPSQPNVMAIGASSGQATMDVMAGFTSALSFFYANQTFADITVYSGLDGAGRTLASANLAQTPFPVDPLQCDFALGCFEPFGLGFSGMAQSVIFHAGVPALIAFDDVTLGSKAPAVVVPEPATLRTFGLGLLLVGGFVALRRRRPQG